MSATHPKNDTELAEALKTSRKGIRRWRDGFGAAVPPTRNVAAWMDFMRDNMLGPFSEQRGCGEIFQTPQAPAPAPSTAGRDPVVFSLCGWENRRAVLFETMELLHESFLEGQLDPVEYADIGGETVDLLCALAKAWKLPPSQFDSLGFRKNWTATLTTIARDMLAKRGA